MQRRKWSSKDKLTIVLEVLKGTVPEGTVREISNPPVPVLQMAGPAFGQRPKGNADTERVIRTIKEDLIWPSDFQTPFELQAELDSWVMDYNTDYPHSSLNYRTPCEYEKLCLAKIP